MKILFAQESKINFAKAIYTNDKIIIDGNLNEPIWQNVESISDFSQRELNEGNKVTERTEVKLLYDDENLYVGV